MFFPPNKRLFFLSDIGARVVRGPDWQWDKQDGGEGHVGTIRSFESAEEVVVVWDNGVAANYRCADAYDLRVLDAGPTGVKHDWTCDSCHQRPIFSVLWQCAECPNCCLCSGCYNNDKHSLKHRFWRLGWPGSGGCIMEPRKKSKKIAIRGLFPGARVVRGIDWQWDNQDGGAGGRGKLYDIQEWSRDFPRSAAYVVWDNGSQNLYRLGYEGMVDLKYISDGKGGSYYRDHLLPLGSKRDGALQFRPGQSVNVELDYELVRSMQGNHGGWDDKMNEIFTSTGTVMLIDGDHDVVVEYPSGNRWTLNPAILCRTFNQNVSGLVAPMELSLALPGQRVTGLSENEYLIMPSTSGGGMLSQLEVGDVVRISDDVTKLRECTPVSSEHSSDFRTIAGKYGQIVSVSWSNATVRISDAEWSVSVGVLSKPTRVLNSRRIYLKPKRGNPFFPFLPPGSSSNYATELVKAAMEGNLAKCSSLVTLADLNSVVSEKGMTPLKAAIIGGHAGILKILIEHGCILDVVDETGSRPIHIAAVYGHISIAKLLLKSKVDINARNRRNNETALHIASSRGDNPLTTLLLEAGAHPSLQNINGDTPMHLALDNGADNVVNVLAVHKADVALVNNDGYNVIHEALRLKRTSKYNLVRPQPVQAGRLHICILHGVTPWINPACKLPLGTKWQNVQVGGAGDVRSRFEAGLGKCFADDDGQPTGSP
ncbi:MIB HERC2 and Ank and Ank 2 domain containing pro tein [Trichuris trichiura]|uniref:RING-type E3 ubiquitin transferase n=1 Tax=Trichuris trichiura TaxID=36087 RepID=A0A077Z7I3_TRITR|nr:MIB HERC2 and Ank and Ank 2 domain containing pro tein [Trichuris trichiura]